MLRYTLHPNTKSALWIVIGTLACVTAVVAFINAPIFQPQVDDALVFMRNDGVDMEIFTMDADGTNERQLTNNEYEDWAAVWTPDKSQIVFHSDRAGYYGIYIMDRDGSNVSLISPESHHAQFPSVSPDGQYIAFEMWMGEGNNWDIFVKAIHCGALEQITFGPGHEGGAAWSPDGTQIGYHSTQAAQAELGYDIYVVNLDGTGTQRMTTFSTTMDVWPQWSPDGSQIIFHSERDGNSEIYIMDAAGSNQHNLSNNPALDRVPRFTPDGKHIVFRSERNGDSEIFIMNVDGSNPQRLTDNDLRDMHPDS